MAQVSSRAWIFWSRLLVIAFTRFGLTSFSNFDFMNGSAVLGSFWSCYVVASDSVSLRFEFSFMNGSSFEPCRSFGRVCYVVGFQIRFHESVEYWLGHARVDAVRQELESQVRQAC